MTTSISTFDGSNRQKIRRHRTVILDLFGASNELNKPLLQKNALL